ncbi:MAG: hypothetical protein ABSH25_10340 [Syntrophorhabdales bacterium]|jgi:hypothetical protein
MIANDEAMNILRALYRRMRGRGHADTGPLEEGSIPHDIKREALEHLREPGLVPRQLDFLQCRCVGRRDELSLLVSALNSRKVGGDDPFINLEIGGNTGVGKNTILEAVLETIWPGDVVDPSAKVKSGNRGGNVVVMDIQYHPCGNIEHEDVNRK